MIKFAIVGLGHIGMRHAAHIINHPQAELTDVCDIDTKKFNALHNLDASDINVYTDFQTMLLNTQADVISVCTPNYLHATHTVSGLQSNKHVIVEKPMALSTKECDRMIQVAEEHNKIIFAVKQNRYNPPVAAVKDLITKSTLGKIFMVQVNCFWNRSDAYYAQSDWRGKKAQDGGCLFTQFSHFIDILYYLNGNVKNIKGSIQNFAHRHNTEFEDSGAFVMEGDNGSIVNFNFSTCAYQKNMEGSITILAEKGTIKIGGQYLNTIEFQNIQDEQLPEINITAKANNYGLYQGSMSNHDKMIQNVIDVLKGKAVITTTAQEGKEVVSIIERMYESVK